MKKLQILRVDNDVVEKVDLQIGENIIGRNIVIGSDDDRVIKHAVIINVKSDNEMTITPYQITPCYMKSIESSRWQLLKLGTTVPIKPGDICSLVPDKCWFKVISATNEMENNEEYSLKRKASENVESNIHDKKLRSESGEGDNLRSSCNALSKILNNDINLTKVNVEENVNEDNLSHDKDKYKTLDPNCNLICAVQNMDQTSVMKDECKLQNINKTKDEAPVNDEDLNLQKNSNLPSMSEDNGSSTIKDKQSSVQKEAQGLNFTNATVNAPKREKCKYGKKCYRKKSQHKAKFSHPGDSDYDIIDNREECPYGIKCYRKNPQHREQFKHMSTSARNNCNKHSCKKTRVEDYSDTSENLSAEESVEESVDESEYDPSTDIESSDDELDGMFEASDCEASDFEDNHT